MMPTPSGLRKQNTDKDVPHTRVEGDVMLNDNYEVGKKIGEGSFGKVYEVVHKGTGTCWAMKSLNKDKASSSTLKQVEREVSILKRVNHPHIINLKEVVESSKRMYLVMELCTRGQLADVLKEREHFTETETKLVMTRLCGAISYLHKHGIVHRDLKLENILLAENPQDPDDILYIKVGDFGLSVVMGGVTPDNMMQEVCGTPIYMAPEILDNKTYSQQCDVWAMGVIMYTLLCGYPPFRAKEETVLYDLIREAEVKFDNEIWKSVSEEAKNCIGRMLKVDPAHRISAAEVLDHPWITGATQDVNQPSNVLEMMRLWKDDLKYTDDEQSGSPDTDLSEKESDGDVGKSGSPTGLKSAALQASSSKKRSSRSFKRLQVPGSGTLSLSGSSTSNVSTVDKGEPRKKPEGKHAGHATNRSSPKPSKSGARHPSTSISSVTSVSSSHQLHKSMSGQSVASNLTVKNGSGNGTMKGASSKVSGGTSKPKKK